uniref:Uncharacterized protein n=1 Tax=Anguilla anguilla TaxID=7936 RepID=A0A0E9XY31_ANGAN
MAWPGGSMRIRMQPCSCRVSTRKWLLLSCSMSKCITLVSPMSPTPALASTMMAQRLWLLVKLITMIWKHSLLKSRLKRKEMTQYSMKYLPRVKEMLPRLLTTTSLRHTSRDCGHIFLYSSYWKD